MGPKKTIKKPTYTSFYEDEKGGPDYFSNSPTNEKLHTQITNPAIADKSEGAV